MNATASQHHRPARAWRRLAAAGSLALLALAAPATAATAAPSATEATETSGTCAVGSAELRWGVKESFRSYVSGSIANGEWTVSDDMRYETPDFIWDAAQGELQASPISGSIGFTGAVHFTGHDGALQFDLSDPTIEIEGGDTAYLGLTIGATDDGDAAAVQAQSVRVAKMDLAGALSTSGGELEIAGAVPRLTSEGAAAFNGEYGSYVAGDELDPINLTATAAGCELGETVATPEPDAPAEPTATPEPTATEVPWVPIVVGGVALLVIGVTGGMLIAGRGKGKKPADAADPEPPTE
ncbi:HtaA domain-containing protein [Leucobacter sp. gxy201]|uniref:HtaA domain-containing protein n=1 Tax=Leucobacter sp. gxy201 TaxID=2957200 RepID=UPI003DA0415A